MDEARFGRLLDVGKELPGWRSFSPSIAFYATLPELISAIDFPPNTEPKADYPGPVHEWCGTVFGLPFALAYHDTIHHAMIQSPSVVQLKGDPFEWSVLSYFERVEIRVVPRTFWIRGNVVEPASSVIYQKDGKDVELYRAKSYIDAWKLIAYLRLNDWPGELTITAPRQD